MSRIGLSVNAHMVARLARLVGRAGIIVNEHTLGEVETIRHVEVLARWFEFIALDELQARLERPGRPFCLLTFDDGKKSNATITAPVLRRMGVPAVFYVVTDFVSDGEPLWFDEYRTLLRRVGSPPPGLEGPVVKKLTHHERSARLRRAMHDLGLCSPSSEDVQAMSWGDARALVTQGFVIGAHGRTHAILTRESRGVALHEIEDSLACVSRELGAQCRTFAFPNGNYNTELSLHAVACGATTVMTTDPTWVDRGSPLWRLPRVQLYTSSSATHIRLKVALATIPGALTNPDGTGRGYRLRASRAMRWTS